MQYYIILKFGSKNMNCITQLQKISPTMHQKNNPLFACEGSKSGFPNSSIWLRQKYSIQSKRATVYKVTAIKKNDKDF